MQRLAQGREALPGNCAGIAANPMNQAELSKIPLGTLSRLAHAPERYEPTTVFEEIAETLFGAAVARALAADLTRLHDDGLEHLDAAQVTELRRKYAQLNAAVSEEICAWLDGFYEPSAELMAEFESFAQQQSSE